MGIPGSALGSLSYRKHESSLPCLTHLIFSAGWGSTYTINCSGFGQHGLDPTDVHPVFVRKALPIITFTNPIQVNISFTITAILDVDEQLQLMSSFLWLEMVWDNPLMSWNPEECEGITKISMATKNLWLPDIFIVELMDVDKTPEDLTAFVSNEGRIRYKKPMKVASMCNLDIFYFPFDQQNCTLTFSSFLYTVDNMLLGMEKEAWEIVDASRDDVQAKGEWELLDINKATSKTSMGTNLYDQITFYVAIRRRPRRYVVHLLVPSGFLVAIDALSFYLPPENENRAPFKMTLLLGYNVFLLMMNDLLPVSGIPLISIYFALCLSLMVASLLETIFITYLLHLATTQPPPMPQGLHTLLLHCSSPRRGCPSGPCQGNLDLGLTATNLSGLKEPVDLIRAMPSSREAGLTGCPESARAQRELAAQKQHLVELWVQFSHLMDTLLFRLYLLFIASFIITVVILWNT
ncbi:PREDICTED: 5-hydroxytryptamine receptor 3E-like [Dipodomys ordii]|uniref:5-hydroxytryptamine receptor 3E-like n=1 Tax=Dipodomys ordii TaxID=10020 RepID=A0A1S3GI62_DIPOR|nr:PREDICTED: 5-hydroxytryptamine receptor 3E-like [Dipodomys ordii]